MFLYEMITPKEKLFTRLKNQEIGRTKINCMSPNSSQRKITIFIADLLKKSSKRFRRKNITRLRTRSLGKTRWMISWCTEMSPGARAHTVDLLASQSFVFSAEPSFLSVSLPPLF
jgi:hypothetical protein